MRGLSNNGQRKHLRLNKPSIALPLLTLPLIFAMADGGTSREAPPESYSFDAGVKFLADASANWRAKQKCVTCHTNGWGLAAQPLVAPRSDEVNLGREFAQGYLAGFLTGEVEPRGQYGSVEGMVATAAFLALSDARTGSAVHETTRRGLDHAWDLLDESGTWEDWLQCNWPPFESDAEYGPTLMLVALGELKGSAELTAADTHGAQRLVKYLTGIEPVSLHAKAMRLWAASYWPKALSSETCQAWHKELLAARKEDGGWSMASLSGSGWQRDGDEAQTETSEAYPTAFSIYVLLETGMPRTDEVAEAALRWLREHQREDGDWFTRSPRRDGKHYISRAATAFALMALTEKK
ncbi:MAG: hypothetical protein ACI8QS_003281 [Planctomycetota bacterium]|jgi:hypothetical protein